MLVCWIHSVHKFKDTEGHLLLPKGRQGSSMGQFILGSKMHLKIPALGPLLAGGKLWQHLLPLLLPTEETSHSVLWGWERLQDLVDRWGRPGLEITQI